MKEPDTEHHWKTLDDADYTVKHNARAKHLSVRFTRAHGMVVTVPKHLSDRKIKAMLQQRRQWIEQHLNSADYQAEVKLPEHIELHAIDMQWKVEYRPTTSKRIELKELPNNLTDYEQCILHGAVSDHDKCIKILNHWLKEKAEDELIPWIYALSEEHNLPISSVTIRNQSRRWGSCSSVQQISLNQKLLFLPPNLVEHILLHELCHTVHMNHSSQFWAMLASLDPDCDIHHATTRKKAWNEYVPLWTEYSGRK